MTLVHLPGFETIDAGERLWLARPGLAPALRASPAAALLEGGSPPPAAPGSGRGGTMRVTIAGRSAVAKRALHGGLLGPLLAGVFWGTGRGRRVVQAADRLRAASVRTPEVLAAGWRRLIGPFRAHVLVTETVLGAINLQLLLAGMPRSRQRRDLLAAAGRAVGELHAERFLHRDLNLANLLATTTDGPIQVHVVDLDRGVFVERVGFGQRRRNLRRLLRSYEKWLATAQPLETIDGLAFLRAYCAGDRRLLRRLFRALELDRRRLWLRCRVWRWIGGGAHAGTQ